MTNLKKSMPFRHCSIRFFISSTFADMVPERNVISSIMTKLHAEYSLSGWSIDYIDLRWGVSKESSAHNNTMRICIEELKRCKNLSPRPNFIFLIGDRYGWLPLPEIIYPDEWNKIYEYADTQEKNSLKSAYKFDSNCLPTGRYLLQPLEDYDRTNRLNNLFDKFYKEDRLSATEQEIVEGVFKVKDAGEHVVGYIRELNSVPQHLQHIYRDNNPILARHVNRLKNKLKEILPSENILLSGQTSFSEYNENRYIEWFETEMEIRIRRVIEREIQSHILPQSEFLHNFNLDFAKRHATYFYGRERELSELLAYINSKGAQYPMLIPGEPGLGKTSVISKGITMAMQIPDCVLIPRFIGSGDRIYSLNDLVVSIFNALHPYFSQEGREAYPHPIDRYEAALIINNNNRLDETWFHLLEKQLLPGKYVIFIDAIDRIPKYEDRLSLFRCLITGAHSNLWGDGPKIFNMFEKLRIIVSAAIDGDQIECNDLDRYEYLRIAAFDEGNKYSLISGLLASRGRKISQHQNDILTRTLKKSESRGIYLDVIGKYLCSLTSFSEIKNIPETFTDAVRMILNTLSETGSHNRNLLREFLAVIATAPDGIDIHSLNGILACDEDLVKELIDDSFHEFNIDESRGMLPPILLSRLYSDLEGVFIATMPTVLGDAIIIRHKEILKVVKDWLGSKELKKARILQYRYYREAWKEGNRFAINDIARVTSEVVDKENAALELASVLCDIGYLSQRINISEKNELNKDFNSLILMSEDIDYLRASTPDFRKIAALLSYLPARVEAEAFHAWCRNLPFECIINKDLIKDTPANIMTDQLRMFDFSRSIEGKMHRNSNYRMDTSPHFALRYDYRLESNESCSKLIRVDQIDRHEDVVFSVKLGEGECRLHPFIQQDVIVMTTRNSVSCFGLISNEKLFQADFKCEISLHPQAVSISGKGRYLKVDAYLEVDTGIVNPIFLLIDLYNINPTLPIPKGNSAKFSRSENYLWATYGSDTIIRWDLTSGKGVEVKYQDSRFPAANASQNIDFFPFDALDDKMLFRFPYGTPHHQIHHVIIEMEGTTCRFFDLPSHGVFSIDGNDAYILRSTLDLLSLKRNTVKQYPIHADSISFIDDKTIIGVDSLSFLMNSPLYNLEIALSEGLHYFPTIKIRDCSGFSVSNDGHTICVSNFQSDFKDCIVIYKYKSGEGWYKKLLHHDLGEPLWGLYSSCLSPSGEVVVCAGSGGGKCRIQILRVIDNEILADIPVPHPIAGFRFSTDGKTIVAAETTHGIAYNTPPEGFKFRIIEFKSEYDSSYTIREVGIPTIGENGKIVGYWSFDLTPDNRRIIFDGLVLDLVDGRVLTQIPLPTTDFYYHLYGYAYGKREKRLFAKNGLVIGSGRGIIEIFDAEKEMRIAADCEDTVIAMSPDACWLLMRTPECSLYRTDLTLTYRKTLKGKMPENIINAIFHPSKKAFFAITRDSGIYFCNMDGDILAYALAVGIIDAMASPEGLVVVREGIQVSIFSPSQSVLDSLPSWEFDDYLLTESFRQLYFNRKP